MKSRRWYHRWFLEHFDPRDVFRLRDWWHEIKETQREAGQAWVPILVVVEFIAVFFADLSSWAVIVLALAMGLLVWTTIMVAYFKGKGKVYRDRLDRELEFQEELTKKMEEARWMN